MAMDQRLPVIELKSKLEEQVELINKNLHCAYHQVLQSQKFDQEQPIKDSLLMGIVNVKNMENNLKTLTERLLNLSKDHLNLKDANLNLKEENLGLRQKIWDWERSSHFSRQEESNFKEKVECAVKQKEEELAACGKKLEVYKKKLVKMEKWIKRRFQKVHFFLRDMQADEKNIAKLRSLTRRVKDYSSKKPWRKEIHRVGKEAQVQVSDHGTSTPFSHYSSFDSQDSSRKLQAKKQKIENIFYESKETKSFNSQTKNELTRKKSKSIFSKSLSVLEKAKRIFNDLEKDESDISKRKDVKMRDVAAKSSSDLRDISIHDMDNDISKLIKASKAYGQDNNWKAQGLQILDYKQEYQKRQSNEDSDSNKASQYIQKRLVFDRHNKHDLIEPTSRSSKYYDLNADSALLNNNCKKGNKEPQPPNPGPNMVKKKSIGTIEIKKSSKDKPQLQKGTAGLVKQERRSKSKGYNGHSLRDEISGESNYNSYIHGRSSSGNGQIAKSKSKSQPRKRLLKGKEKLETTSNLGKYFSLKTRSKKSETESNIFDRMIAEHFMNKGRTSHYISQEMIKESNRNSKVQDIGRRLNSIRKKAVDEKQYGGSNGKTEETKEKIKKIKVEKTKKKDRAAMLQSAEDGQGMHPKRYTSM